MSRNKYTKAGAAKLTDAEIDFIFSEIDGNFGGKKSTEFLLHATAERCGTSYAHVVNALGNVAALAEPKEAGQ